MAVFGPSAEAALDVLELTEFAWHACYGEVSPPDQVVDDILTVSEGRLDLLAHAARLAVEGLPRPADERPGSPQIGAAIAPAAPP